MFSRLFSRLSLVLLAFIFLFLLAAQPAQADIITDRSVTLGTYTPSATTSQNFKFSLPNIQDTGSIVFEYCANSPDYHAAVCTPPPGLDVSSAVLVTQAGNTGFSIDGADGSANKIVLSRPAAPADPAPDNYIFNNAVNPSTPGVATFVRISTHASSDGSGPNISTGAVAFAVQSIFNVNAFVPPFMQLCVGVSVAPDCSSTSGDSIDLGILSSSTANKGQSQYSVATNDNTGYVVFALGTTMTSGNNIIPALNTLSPSFPGTGQFGINLRANLIPIVGQNPVSLGINSTGLPAPNYNVPNRFIYIDGDTISSSNLPSNYNRMTVSYLVNVPKNQPPGIYSTTITYLATVQF